MLTRKAVAQSAELKLKQALEELKQTKETCSQLLRERDVNEEETKNVIDRNTYLKTELSQLHAQYLEVLNQKELLQITVSSIDEQLNTHERALNRITDLERELIVANKRISQLLEQQKLQEPEHAQSLFDELLLSPGVQSEKQIQTTCHNNTARPLNLGSNKLKKYVKVNRIIRKTEKLIKKNKCFHKNIALRKERICLIDSLEIYDSKLSECRRMYDRDTEQLQCNIIKLQESLVDIENKYLIAQNQIQEHIKSATTLLELSNYNVDRYESVIKKQLISTNEDSSVISSIHIQNDKLMFQSPSHSPDCIDSLQKCYSKQTVKTQYKTIMFSDKLGQDLSSTIGISYRDSFLNICTPGQSFVNILKSIEQHKVDSCSNVIILCGDSTRIKKRDILNNVNNVLKLQAEIGFKLIISAFPYAKNLTWVQNKRIGDLNMYLYNIICRHNDAILFFDINKFINNFILTADTMYLTKRFRMQIAALLAFNLHDTVIGNTMKTFSNCDYTSSSTNVSNLNSNNSMINSILN